MYAEPVERLQSDGGRKTGKQPITVKCSGCGLYGMCRVAGLEAPKSALIDEVVSRREKVPAGEQVMLGCQPMAELIAVRSGAFVATAVLANGDEQVIDFFLPGELLGLEALSEGRHSLVVSALEQSSICRFDLTRLYLLGDRLTEFQQHLIHALSKHARRAQWVPLLMGAKTAEQRLALFLLGLSSRLSEHDLPCLKFRLPMSRQHIANYLGLAMETVSRIFKRFHSQGTIEVRARNIELRNMDELRAIAGLVE